MSQRGVPEGAPSAAIQAIRYEQMLDALSALGEALVITEAGRMLYCNDAYLRLTGYEREELKSRQLIELAPPELQESLTSRLADRLSGKVRVEHPAESQLVTKDGRRVDCEFSIRMLSGESPGRILAVIRDISNRKVTEAALRDSEARVRAIIDSVADGIVTCDSSGAVLSLNPAARRMFGRDGDGAVGLDIRELVAPFDRQELEIRLDNTPPIDEANASTLPREITAVRSDGSTFPMEYVISPMTVGLGRLLVANMRDISDRRAQTEALEYQALHDGLTGLPNRSLFGDRLRQALISAGAGERIALLILDLDRFKDINDTLGHEYGDGVLAAFGERLREVVPEPATVARLGGDEFAILPSGNASVEQAVETARSILSALQQPFTVGAEHLSSSASIGIAMYPDHGSDAASLIRRADVAMYVAKRTSSGFAIYEEHQDRHSAERLSILSELRGAIAAGQLTLEYQPKVDLARGTTAGFEALLRWDHPAHGRLLPDRFVPLAEQSELIRPLSLWVIDAALQQVRRWRDLGMELTVGVNLSPRNLHDLELVDQVREILDRNSVDPSWLILEITESAAIEAAAAERLPQISALGVNLSIDDFGMGYSSLSYLKRLPVSELKIDRTFITDLDSNADDAGIVRPTIALGHNLGLKVVAEGVENAASARILLECDCDYAQGFHFSPSMDGGTAVDWLRDGGWPVRPPE